MADPPDVSALVDCLISDNEGTRKYAVFKLQTLLQEPSFVDAFLEKNGLYALRHAALETSGNTQAYAFGSLDVLLSSDIGWAAVDAHLIDRAVELAATHPLVNIVRNVLTLLVLVVSREPAEGNNQGLRGFAAIEAAFENHPDFLESLVQRLSAADHSLCANALQLVNALIRDLLANGEEDGWPKFVRRLQDLGVIGRVGMLMRSDSSVDLGSPLAAAILEFQRLTKVLLRKWKGVPVNLQTSQQKRALRLLDNLQKSIDSQDRRVPESETGKPTHPPDRWRRLGFETESPAWDFEETGVLGMMDLIDYARSNEDVFRKTLMEQSAQPPSQRCPLARASLGVTLVLFEHFGIDDEVEEQERELVDRRANVDTLYRPLLLQWGRLHPATLNAFIRLWKAAGAEADDFYKIEELVRVLVDRVVGGLGRKCEVGTAEEQLRTVTLETVRQWQMEDLDRLYEEAWGPHLTDTRQQLHDESAQFMKEQRIRCLLQGAWFPMAPQSQALWRYVRLSPDRRWLHHQTSTNRSDTDPSLAAMPDKIDMDTVTSIDSNVSTDSSRFPASGHESVDETFSRSSQATSMRSGTNMKISIVGMPPAKHLHPTASSAEMVLLELLPPTSALASEWLDGLLMLLNQEPITKDTTSGISMLTDWGIRLRMLNLRWDDINWDSMMSDEKTETIQVPSREGLNGEEYWFDMPESR
ncbi:hypothetical protein K470DRAFT_219776 [Piedraia hortae CBS 480.64]|uniref:ELMO domain-containing protein n=1 Tax=Piedraia hortae CBS 480.64 TaxID=1314780 RepID=A0A6A7BWS9_9PEZI|nr:hypothetical protein K470DRAFT_219776 [Piedraia hortae CBS 480.64]